MKLLDIISADARQEFAVSLDDNSRVTISLWYSSMQAGWFYSVSRGTFSVTNRRMVNSPNLLRAFRDVIPFGLSCVISDGQEPVFIDDFSTGRAKLYILDVADVSSIEDNIIVAGALVW